MNIPSDIDKLVVRHIVGQITHAELVRLETWLREDPRHIQWFASYGLVEQGLLTVGRESTATDLMAELSRLDAMSAPSLVDLTHELHRRELEQSKRENASYWQQRQTNAASPGTVRVIVIPKAAVWLGLAAVIGIALWIGAQNSRPPKHTPVEITEVRPPTQVHQRPAVQPTPLPTPPARLLATHRAEWSASSAAVEPDGAMAPGEYRLETGYAHLAMADGATVIVHGPAILTIDTGSRVSLATGVLSAYVPEGAEGFAVDTPAGRVLDLGTEFGVEVVSDDLVEVHVMAGRVVASLEGQSETRTMRAGDAGRMNTAAASIEPVVIHTQKFARDWMQAEQSVRVSDAVRYLYDTPESVRAGALEDNDSIFLLPERRGVELQEDLLCDFTQSGLHDRVASQLDLPTLPAGTAVDSYLVHYDRVGTPAELVEVRGVIHFDRPVVGVFVDDRQLAATDALFQNPQAQYPDTTDISRGLEGREHPTFVRPDTLPDVLELSPDRKVLTIRMATSNGIDQLRVLVEASP